MELYKWRFVLVASVLKTEVFRWLEDSIHMNNAVTEEAIFGMLYYFQGKQYHIPKIACPVTVSSLYANALTENI